MYPELRARGWRVSDDYLALLYGADWRMPNPEFNQNRDERASVWARF